MASPAFSINGGSVGAKASVSAGATVTATLDSTDGVRSVEWSIARTDESTATTDYALVTSGPVDNICTTTALTAGTAAALQCRVNGGVDASLGASSSALTTTVKFYVETTSSLEVLCAGELEDNNREASATHGAVDPLNDAIRSVTATSGIANGAYTGQVATWSGAVWAGGDFIAIDDSDALPTTGHIRFGNASSSIYRIDNAGVANVRVMDFGVGSNDGIRIGESTYTDAIDLFIANGGTYSIKYGAREFLSLTASQFDFGNTTDDPDYEFLGTGLVDIANGTADIPAGASLALGGVSCGATVTAANLTELTDTSTTTLHNHTHNSLSTLQGGAVGEYYHLTAAEHSLVTATAPVTTDNAVARFNGIAGIVQDSAVIIDDSDAITGVTSLVVDNLTLDSGSITSSVDLRLDAGANSIIALSDIKSVSSNTLDLGKWDNLWKKIWATDGDFATSVTTLDLSTTGDVASSGTSKTFSVTSTGSHTFSGADLSIDEACDFGSAGNITASGNPAWNTGTNSFSVGGFLYLYNDVTWASTATTPKINQATLSSGTGQLMTIGAQNVVTGTGGSFVLKPGSGSVAGGQMVLKNGAGAATITIDDALINFPSASPITATGDPDWDFGDGDCTFGGGIQVDEGAIDLADSDTAVVSAAGQARFIYDSGSNALMVSIDEDPYDTIITTYNQVWSLSSTTITPNSSSANTVHFPSGIAPTIGQVLLSSGTGGLFTFSAQNVTTGTGGAMDIKPGDGSVAGGQLALQDGSGSDKLTIDDDTAVVVTDGELTSGTADLTIGAASGDVICETGGTQTLPSGSATVIPFVTATDTNSGTTHTEVGGVLSIKPDDHPTGNMSGVFYAVISTNSASYTTYAELYDLTNAAVLATVYTSSTTRDYKSTSFSMPASSAYCVVRCYSNNSNGIHTIDGAQAEIKY